MIRSGVRFIPSSSFYSDCLPVSMQAFRCPVEGCDKTFTVKSNCKRHMRTHGMSLEESSRRFEEYGGRGRSRRRNPSPSEGSTSSLLETRGTSLDLHPSTSDISSSSSIGVNYSAESLQASISMGEQWEETQCFEFYSDELSSPVSHAVDDWELAAEAAARSMCYPTIPTAVFTNEQPPEVSYDLPTSFYPW